MLVLLHEKLFQTVVPSISMGSTNVFLSFKSHKVFCLFIILDHRQPAKGFSFLNTHLATHSSTWPASHKAAHPHLLITHRDWWVLPQLLLTDSLNIANNLRYYKAYKLWFYLFTLKFIEAVRYNII